MTKSQVANFEVLIAKNVFALVYRTAVYGRWKKILGWYAVPGSFLFCSSRPLRGRRPVIPLRGAPTGRKLEREVSPRYGGKGNDHAKTDVPEPPHNFPPCVASFRTMWKSKRLNKRPNGGEIHSVELFPQKKLPFRPHLWKFISPPVKPLKRQMGHVSRFI